MTREKYITHLFMAGDTITAAIRACNNMHSFTNEELHILIQKFNQLNPDAIPPIPGQTVKIPLWPGIKGTSAR